MAEATGTTSEVIRQAPFLEEFQRDLLEQAFARGQTPFSEQTFGKLDTQVAGLDPLTQQAMQTGAGIGQYMPYLQQAADTTGQGIDYLTGQGQAVPGYFDQARTQAAGSDQMFDPTSAAAYQNPFEDQVVQQTLSDINRQGALQQQALNAQAANAGAFGGSRSGIMQTELGRNMLDTQARTAGQLRQQGYASSLANAQNAFEAQQKRQQGLGTLLGQLGQGQGQFANQYAQNIAGLGSQQANLGVTGQNMLGQQAQLQSQLGSLGQTQAQRELDATSKNAFQRAYEPYQRLSFMSDIFKPSISPSTSSFGVNTAPSPSRLSEAIGAGIGAFGLNKAFGNPFGLQGQGQGNS